MPRRNPKAKPGGTGGRRRWLGRRGRVNLSTHKSAIPQRPIATEERGPREGDRIEVLITDVNRRGEGVGSYGNMRVTVRGAADPGEIVRAVVKRIRGREIYAEME